LKRESSTSGSEDRDPTRRLGVRALGGILLLALAVRLAAIAAFGFSSLRFGDAHAYLTAAETLARTGRYPRQTDYASFRAPGYPFFLVAATLGDPRRVPLAKVANAVLGAAGALLLAALSARIFRRRGIAVATGLAAAIDPSFVFAAADVQSEPLFSLLLLVSAFLLLVCVDRPSSNAGVAAGAAFALAALTRPSALALAPLLVAPLFDRRHPWRARAHLAASALLGFALTMTPWTIRNLTVYREVLPVNDFAGVALYLGNSDLMARFDQVRTRADYDAWLRDLGGLAKQKQAELVAAGATSPAQRLRAYWRITLAERRANPAATARLLWLKTRDWLRPYPNPLFWPRVAIVAVGGFYTLLFLLAVPGLLASPRSGISLFAVSVLALSMLSHVLLIVVWRYRAPYWDPVLLLHAVPGAVRLFGARA
jgi:hypothetical protein